jgi:hypothetical protein
MARALDLGPDPANLPPLPTAKLRKMPAHLLPLYARFSGYKDRTLAISFAIKDVSETLTLHRDKPITEPYVAKLLAEFDGLVELRRYLTTKR